MRSWSIPAGRLFGVEVRIHLTFLFLLLFVWMTEAPQAGGVGRGLALVGLIFASVLAHEMGHLAIAQQVGMPVRVSLLLPIGGLSFSEESSFNRSASPLRREIPVALAGPVVSLGIAMLAIMLALALSPEALIWKRPYLHSGDLLRSLVWVNLYLAALNLLPAYPLDGGRVLRALLAQRMELLPATRVAVTVGQVFAMLFMLAGGVWNYWLTMVGLFLFFAAQIEERTMVFQSVLETVRLEDVMLTDFSTLSPADTLEDALNKAVHTLQDDFPVVRGSDMVGVVSRQKIVEALRANGNAYVQSIMSRAFEIAGRDDSLALAFRKLSARGLTILPVVEQERLVGIITLQNLMHSIGLLAESRMLQKDQS
ncbi:MAG TPA: site-2 protease family protein [Terriglobales bacterium]|nr:site-2 protease family protein [Terriglobales bacterium]